MPTTPVSARECGNPRLQTCFHVLLAWTEKCAVYGMVQTRFLCFLVWKIRTAVFLLFIVKVYNNSEIKTNINCAKHGLAPLDRLVLFTMASYSWDWEGGYFKSSFTVWKIIEIALVCFDSLSTCSHEMKSYVEIYAN